MKIKKGKYVEGTIDEMNALFTGTLQHTPTSLLISERQLVETLLYTKAEAAFICRAVNAHEELMELLKRCRATFVNHEDNFDVGDCGRVREIDQAIAKAEAHHDVNDAGPKGRGRI